MTDWLLSEQLAPHVTDGHKASDPGVYALEIDMPSGGYETLARDWLKYYESTPPYLGRLVDADTVVYVGASKNVRGRIEGHRKSKVRKATLPRIWGVKDIHTVWWYNGKEQAFERENYHALELSKELPASTYVHCR